MFTPGAVHRLCRSSPEEAAPQGRWPGACVSGPQGLHGRRKGLKMERLILISIVLALIAIPVLAARDENPRRGLKRALAGIMAFTFVYAFLLRVVLPRLG